MSKVTRPESGLPTHFFFCFPVCFVAAGADTFRRAFLAGLLSISGPGVSSSLSHLVMSFFQSRLLNFFPLIMFVQ